MSDDDEFPVFVNGSLRDSDEAAIAPLDQGFQFGMAVFDTLLYADGCRYFEEEHLARLSAGAQALSIDWPLPWDPVAALDAVCQAIATPAGEEFALRVTVSRGAPGHGPTLVVTARRVQAPPREGVVVALEAGAKIAADELETIKSTSRARNLLAREAANRRGAWDALVRTDAGDVSEATIANLFAVVGGEVITPALERGCLPGIMRAKVLAEIESAGIPHRVARIELAELARAEELFLTNTTGRVIPILRVLGPAPAPGADSTFPHRELLDRELPVVHELPGSQGAITCELARRIRRLEERYRTSRRADAAR